MRENRTFQIVLNTGTKYLKRVVKVLNQTKNNIEPDEALTVDRKSLQGDSSKEFKDQEENT